MNDERIANASSAVFGISAVSGVTWAQVNEVLQAATFVVAIISGLAATYYYIKKGRQS